MRKTRLIQPKQMYTAHLKRGQQVSSGWKLYLTTGCKHQLFGLQCLSLQPLKRGCVFLLKDALGTVSHTPMPRSSLTHFSARPQLGGTVLDSSLPRLKGASFSKIGGTADSYPVVRHATIISPLWSRIRAEPLAGQLMVVKVSMLWTRC